mmetsp:Transcript_28054/g.53409  ORF Transcript_28054/g.53409 Transcript_28054/m.53409 type:complete len:446 (-) Transcript_28054:171-1508(-)|eukprot:CAMPEP_0114250986 /NCGR_PEP_ID=MMETSP0058-20121206/15011_1 /TAXON_ID=36894 /ORGANISM="Pyramimonas parkeae, CCMP726" /LENGTH=445 /DNA_ID=CAMNT_0001364721 /DNA_START=151 /DNA_END=1488 /DNA_ORIENTATION=+
MANAISEAVNSGSALRVAVLGGGVAGCAFTYGIRQHFARRAPGSRTGNESRSMIGPSTPTNRPVELEIFEMGYAAGGRTATRGSRDIPALRINHGAPCFDVVSPRFRMACEELAAEGFVKPFDGVCGTLSCGDSSYEFTPNAHSDLFVGTPGMSALCRGLLNGVSQTEDCNLQVSPRFSTMVRGIKWVQGSGWRLYDETNELLGEFDWLAITSSGICHSRWTDTFGDQPPMLEAAAALGDPHLDQAIACVAKLDNHPVSTVMMAFTGEAAEAWGALPFSIAKCEDNENVAKLVVERLEDGMVTVVVHSTKKFADATAGIYGSTSTVARVTSKGSQDGQSSAGDGPSERDVIDMLVTSLQCILVPNHMTEEQFKARAMWGPHLHRWGAAFPMTNGLDPTHAHIPSAQVVFCGDYVSDSPSGRVEDAAISGLAAADALMSNLSLPRL